MEHIAAIKQFNKIAITNKLTGLQMQLWHEIFTRVCESSQDLCISTAELLELLQVSRCQFQRARSGLVQAGLLAMRKVSNQTVFYTVLLNNEVIAINFSDKASSQKETEQQKNEISHAKQCQKATLYPKSVDVIGTGSYHGEIIKFCSSLRAEGKLELETELMNWCAMRKEHGWRLTLQGLQGLLQKLKDLGAENIATMLEIVRTSIRRKWKGFYEFRVESKPNGQKLLEREQKERNYNFLPSYYNGYQNRRNNKTVGRLPKYDTKIEDLDFLEW